MQPEGRVSSGGFAYDIVWVACELSSSRKSDEVVVTINPEDSVEVATFYVDIDLVRPSEIPQGKTISGHVRSALLEVQNGTAIVEIPGEAVSYGPKLFVSRTLIE